MGGIGGANKKDSPHNDVASEGDDVTASEDVMEQQDVDRQESEPVFDQILDLSSCSVDKAGAGESGNANQVMIGAPIIAFEDANTSGNANSSGNPLVTPPAPQVEVPTGGKHLSSLRVQP